MPRVIRLKTINGGPCDQTVRAIAKAKYRFRNDDLRAFAYVAVTQDGTVATGYGGAAHHNYELSVGIETLKRRVAEGE